MAFANTSVSDIVATTIESRTREIADNVTKNNALLARLSAKGKVKTFSGGSQVFQELAFAENSNAGWYSGYDLLPTAAQDVISSAAYTIKQLAVPVVISGLEMLQNNGREALIDLLEARVSVAESTMANYISHGVYSDGTAFGGKQLVGLASAILATPTSGTYGGIDRGTWTFWRNQTSSTGALTTANVQPRMNGLYVSCMRGKDAPDLIAFDNNVWQTFTGSLQLLQRFTDANQATLGFPSVKFMNADVVPDGGIGGFAPANVGYFLNTDYLFLRPHANRNMVPLAPDRRSATNQDAEVQILGWAGAFTVSNMSLQGYFSGS